VTLPEGWAETTIAEAASINPKHAPDTDRNQRVSFIPMPAVDEHLGAIVENAERILADVWTGYTHFADGDVIFAKITPCMENGKAAIARGLTGGIACGSTEFYVLRPANGISADYLWRFVRQPSFRAEAETRMTGAVGQRRVPRDYLESHPLPLPPEAEQRRILAKLDALTARLARARAELDRASVLAERLRQNVLSDVFRPLNISTAPLGDLLEDVRYGTAQKCDYGAGISPVLRIPNIQRGKIDLSDLKSANFDDREIARLSLREGDVLVIRSNGSLDLVGRSAVVAVDAVGMLYAGYLIRLRPTPSKLLPVFLHYFLASPGVRQALVGAAKSTSGVNNVNSQELQALKVPLLPLEDQERAVTRIAMAFARADRVEADAARARALIDRLESSILAKAFRGELVPQDPNDEPASVLLDRIRTQRAAAPKAKRARHGVSEPNLEMAK